MKSSSFFFFFPFYCFLSPKKYTTNKKKSKKSKTPKKTKKKPTKKNIILLVFAQSVGSSFFFPHSLFFDSILSSFLHPPQDPWSLLFLSKSQVCFVVFCVCFFVCVFFICLLFATPSKPKHPPPSRPQNPYHPPKVRVRWLVQCRVLCGQEREDCLFPLEIPPQPPTLHKTRKPENHTNGKSESPLVRFPQFTVSYSLRNV